MNSYDSNFQDGSYEVCSMSRNLKACVKSFKYDYLKVSLNFSRFDNKLMFVIF